MSESKESRHPDEPTNEDLQSGAEEPELKNKTSRDAAEITIARVSDYSELAADTEQEGDKQFIKKTRELWREFAVHGITRVDAKTKQTTILPFTDLDGKSSMLMLKLAGIDVKDVKYVAPSSSVEGRINLDTGDKEGLVIEDGGKTAFMDHHAPESGSDSSATKVAYETLIKLGLLKREEHLDKLVEFVTQVDTGSYPRTKEDFKNSYLTVLGLQRFIDPSDLVDYFKDGRSPTKLLSLVGLQRMGLVGRSKEQKKIVDSSLARLAEMDKDGMVVDSDRYGRIVIDLGKTVGAGFDAARGYGCGAYVIWNPKEQNFFINTAGPLNEEFPQGRKVRENMWIKPLHDKTPLTVKLSDVLNAMTDGKVQPRDGLQKVLDAEAK